MDQEMLLRIKSDLWKFLLEFGPKFLYAIVYLGNQHHFDQTAQGNIIKDLK